MDEEEDEEDVELDDDDEEENEPDAGDEEEDEDTEGARTVEIADDDDEEGDLEARLASVGSTTSPVRTQPSPHSPIVGDDHDSDHAVSVIASEDIDIGIDIGIGIDADPSASPSPGPSLGYLDEALSFIAAERERARWSALHGAGASVRVSVKEEGEWMYVIGMYMNSFFCFSLLFCYCTKTRRVE
jgi:hypothetical protein